MSRNGTGYIRFMNPRSFMAATHDVSTCCALGDEYVLANVFLAPFQDKAPNFA